MQELNLSTLKKAIDQLPLYEPDEQLWLEIEDGLDEIELDQKLQKTIPNLVQHNPPEMVWENIEAVLEQEIIAKKEAVKIRPLRKWLALAASVVLLLGLGWWMQNNNKVTITYSEEQIENTLPMLSFDGDDDEAAFAMIDEICKAGMLICHDVDFLNLKTELDELTTARNELKEAMGEFNTDKFLIAQLTEIELERSDVLKKIIAKI